MNPHIQVKEEYPTAGGAIGSSSSLYGEVPQPLEGLHDMGPPPFLTKTYEIVDDPRTDPIVSWSRGNNSFVVWDAQAFSASLLPRYFKHNNFSSFIRQLNTYGFRKVDPDRWEFANEGFLRGQKHLLKNIRRRRATQAPQNVHQTLDPCVEVGRFGIDGEIDRLKRDKQILMMELIKLRQQQQTSRSYLQVMEERLKRTESKQHQMMNFLARAIKNPDFLQQLVQQKDRRKELEEVFGKKKRQRPIDQGPSNVDICDDEVQDLGTSVKVDHQTFGEMPEIEALELPNIAVDMVGGYFVGGSHSSVEIDQIGVAETNQVTGKAINDERFWEDLLNEGSEKEVDLFSVRGEEEEEDVNVLVEQLGDLGSTP